MSDRILHELKEKLPVLGPVMSDSDGLHFRSFLVQTEKQDQADVQAALREFLLEFLDVLGKITAEIISRFLHLELATVTGDSFSAERGPATDSPLSLAKKNREQK